MHRSPATWASARRLRMICRGCGRFAPPAMRQTRSIRLRPEPRPRSWATCCGRGRCCSRSGPGRSLGLGAARIAVASRSSPISSWTRRCTRRQLARPFCANCSRELAASTVRSPQQTRGRSRFTPGPACRRAGPILTWLRTLPGCGCRMRARSRCGQPIRSTRRSWTGTPRWEVEDGCRTLPSSGTSRRPRFSGLILAQRKSVTRWCGAIRSLACVTTR